MKESNNYTREEVYKLFKKFVKDEVHEGDFDQGQSLKQTLPVLDRWFKENIKEKKNGRTNSKK